MKLPQPLERDIQGQILDYLALNQIHAWRVNKGAVAAEYKGKRRFVKFNTIPGCSDIIGILPEGRFLAIEVKRPSASGRPTKASTPKPDQAAFLALINASGGLAFVATCIEDVMREIG